jgi:LacI family transcriptional regulator/LacI family repressor for deo operon, udp, cdd, tsx, nupC, and nupG
MTIKDVAKHAGVSTASVSRIMNKSANVSPDITERITKAVEELGYSPNFLGRNLRRSSTNIILAVIPGTDHSFYNGILGGMQEAAGKQGYDLLIGCTGDSAESEKRLLAMLSNRVADAAVLLGSRLSAEEISSYNKQYNIALACERVPGADVLTVTVDDEAAAYAATELIIKAGHKNIGLLTASGPAISAVDRQNGYESALKKHGITYREEYVYMSSYQYEDGVKAYYYFSKMIDPPTAIFCVSDLLAAAIMKTYAEESQAGGRFFSVVGFDNIQLAELITPGLTTVGQPSHELGKTVINELIAKKADPAAKTNHIKMPFKIYERESLKKRGV